VFPLKLAHLSPADTNISRFYCGKIYVSNAPLKVRLLALPTNIRLGGKGWSLPD
jgi:hypothetical protein